ncbi:MAG: RNA 2'-phosphotransferase [Methanobacteriota archaeon]
MLRECEEHGYFRGAHCPICNEEGRFLMNEHELNRVGRLMAGVLRHFPEKFGVEMDREGWVSIREFVDRLRESKHRLHWIRPYHIEAIVATDPKGRYQCEGDFVRATYGHSVEVDLHLPTENVPSKLFYPVTEEELDVVLERGLLPTDRKKVHLSATRDAALQAGLYRAENPIILVIDAGAMTAKGMEIGQAGKTVFTTDEVPSEYITKE